MSEHTPGPWKAKKWVGTDPYDDPDRPFVMIGNVHWSPNKVDVPAAIEQIANARLIAAAPELLESVEGLADFIALIGSEGDPRQAELITNARAAIAKAKGEE
jgi:hypothetical protein